MATLEELPEASAPGLGYDYDSHGPEGAAGIERSFEPWNRNYLLPVVLPALDGVVERLEAGGTVADVGCGAGVAVCLIAQAFPASEVHGYDISHLALERAERRRVELGLPNAHFHDARAGAAARRRLGRPRHDVRLHPRHDPPAGDDGGHPRRARATTARGCSSTSRPATPSRRTSAKNPMAALMYGMSVLSCMSSALSEPGGAGLGTLGLPESKARAMAQAAGFTRFRRLDIDHPINAFYEVRP